MPSGVAFRSRRAGLDVKRPRLDLDDIQGDVLLGLQKDFEDFMFFKIVNAALFKRSMYQYVLKRVTSTRQVQHRGLMIRNCQRMGRR